MKAIWGLLFSLLLTSTAFAADKTLARFAYEEAEAAFQRDDVPATLTRLNEAERLLGTVNPPILYLRVQARHALLNKGAFLHETYIALKKDADRFFSAYGDNENALDMTRDIYKIAQDVDARQQREKDALDAELSKAEGGDIAALNAVITRYTTGIGTPEDSAKAKQWQGRLAAVELKRDVAAVNDGNIEAMERMAQRYESGSGVKRDAAQAQALRTRVQELQAQHEAEEARRQAELAQQAKEAEIQKKIKEVRYFEYTGTGLQNLLKDTTDPMVGASTLMTTGPFVTALGLVTDAIAAPTKISKVNALKREAGMRAAAWGNPDSLLARALAVHQDSNRQAGVAIPYRVE